MAESSPSFPVIREAVGSFPDREHFHRAVQNLLAAGFAPSDLSVLASHDSLTTAGEPARWLDLRTPDPDLHCFVECTADMMGGPEREVEIGLARARSKPSLQHRNRFGKLSAIGEMLCPGQPESDRLPRAARGREQPDVPDHSPELCRSLSRRSQFGKAPVDERAQPRRIKLRQHPALPERPRLLCHWPQAKRNHRYKDELVGEAGLEPAKA